MRAAVLNAIPADLDIEDIELDGPGPREVLVRTVAAGVCHSDLHFVEGKYRTATPTVMGHESAGVVEAVGDQVDHVAPGDHVIACLSLFCGQCEYCLSGQPFLCARSGLRRPAEGRPRLSRGGTPVGQFADLGGYAEAMLVHQNAVVKIRPDMPLDRAALIGCGVTTGLGAVFRTAAVEPGETVAVVGCGGIGLNCVQGAFIAGASRIVAVDVVPSKLELARQFGATDLVDASEGDPVARVQELTGGGVHHAFEAIGLAQTAAQAFAMARRGGSATIIGMIPLGEQVTLPGAQFLSGKRIQGSVMGSNRFRVDMPRYVELYMQGRLKLDELISARIELGKINDAFAAMKAGSVARSVIVFDQ
ncbi:MAG TPA: Zn-dependent alcohol dehydrogenase [Acidimicrobiales bacterium]|nr:Zn-dependent alcohol dehydrogenase [Acidimicrobiales bacterium]